MAFASKLPEKRFNQIYDALTVKVSEESNAMYQANGCKPGGYKGAWFELLDLWTKDKLTNWYVANCIERGYIFESDSDVDDIYYLRKVHGIS